MTLTNTTTGNPLIVEGDTAADAEIFGGLTYVRFIHWYKPETIGHLFNLVDKNGELIAKEYCDTANTSMWIPVFKTCNGIHCDNLDSGDLIIYIR